MEGNQANLLRFSIFFLQLWPIKFELMVKIQRQNAFEDVKGKKITISSYYHKYVNIGNSLLKCLIKFLKKTINKIPYKNHI